VRFWDASAIVPLLVEEAGSAPIDAIWRRDHSMTVWWGSEIECVSAIARLERDHLLSAGDVAAACASLDDLTLAWVEIEPSARVKELAMRLLRTHALRAADAQQLAAAIVAAEERPSSLRFVTLDARLADAANREGFPVDVPARPDSGTA
jgi:predicted nucleic acid-binding protein